jgi:hypothetical protein
MIECVYYTKVYKGRLTPFMIMLLDAWIAFREGTEEAERQRTSTQGIGGRYLRRCDENKRRGGWSCYICTCQPPITQLGNDRDVSWIGQKGQKTTGFPMHVVYSRSFKLSRIIDSCVLPLFRFHQKNQFSELTTDVGCIISAVNCPSGISETSDAMYGEEMLLMK